MKKLVGAAALAIALAVPAMGSAQAHAHPQGHQPEQKAPSAMTALEFTRELGLAPGQVSRLQAAKDGLKEAHRVHCAPMHASTPTAAQEEQHHREMKEIGDRFEAQAAAALTPEQTASLARLHAARPRPAAPAAGHGEHGAGHGAHHGAAPARPAPSGQN